LENLPPKTRSVLKNLKIYQLVFDMEGATLLKMLARKKVLPRISDSLDKILFAHGGRHPELKGLKTTFTHLREDLEPHLLKEERVIFPLIKNWSHDN
jgi:hypothetical protein